MLSFERPMRQCLVEHPLSGRCIPLAASRIAAAQRVFVPKAPPCELDCSLPNTERRNSLWPFRAHSDPPGICQHLIWTSYFATETSMAHPSVVPFHRSSHTSTSACIVTTSVGIEGPFGRTTIRRTRRASASRLLPDVVHYCMEPFWGGWMRGSGTPTVGHHHPRGVRPEMGARQQHRPYADRIRPPLLRVSQASHPDCGRDEGLPSLWSVASPRRSVL